MRRVKTSTRSRPYAKKFWAVLIRLSSVRALWCVAKPLIGLEPCEKTAE